MTKKQAILIGSVVVAVVVGVLLLKDERSPVAVKPPAVEKSNRYTTPVTVNLNLPPCDPLVNPAVAVPTNCLPHWLAKLPPDPGPAGLATRDGIDADKDGTRDDVQRWLAVNFGHSQRAHKALTILAKSALQQVKMGDSVTPNEAFEFVDKQTGSYCFMRSVDEQIAYSNAPKEMERLITNTKEREDQFWNFQQQITRAGKGHLMPDLNEPIEKMCGYDPAKLPN